MARDLFRDQTWENVLQRLKNREISAEETGPAIVKLGKPFDRTKILAAKDTVALYLDSTDPWARREAMWFLTSWGGLKEYQPALIHALRSDSDPDNRGYAATCLGRLQQGTGNLDAVGALKARVVDEKEEELVRLFAYGAILQVFKGISDLGSVPHECKLSDVDWDWVGSLSKDHHY